MPRIGVRAALTALSVTCACAASRPVRPLSLRRVVLYQNGIGHFEHQGPHHGNRFRLWVKQYEVDDVIKTLTVIDRGSGKGRTVAAVLPDPGSRESDRVAIDVVLSGGPAHDLSVSYAVPTPTWKATYRIALDQDDALLQAWAMVDNVTPDPWIDVALTLATGAPMSFAADLRTPRFVSRPDASGRMVSPTATAPVFSERARRGESDHDHDGMIDDVDRCPDSPEDRDAWDDDDGCPDPDNDRDAIPDVEDRCPMEIESYNGYDDIDGCPDRGRVVLTAAEIRITEKIFFDRDSDAIPAAAGAMLDAVAATLAGNPEITALTLQGHATPDENDPWGLAARRGAAVRAALVARGVSIELHVQPYGDTQPMQAGDTEQARATSRRVELRIAARGGEEVDRSDAPTARLLEESVHSSSIPLPSAGAVRYELQDDVTLPAGASTLVSIINRRVGGEDVLLFRPEAGVPGSDRHPLRAARIENGSGLALEPGPVAVFARGAFVGEGLLERLPKGETAFIPYALDESTWVRVESKGAEEAGRLVSIARGVFTVENRELRTTRYEIAAGTDPTARIFIKHARTAGFSPGELPPGTVEAGDAWLIPIPLTDSRVSVLAVEERRPVRREVRLLLDRDDTTLSLALAGAELPAELRDRVAAAIELRRKAGKLEEEIEALRERLGDTAVRAAELRATLKSVEKTAGAGALRKRLLDRLGEVLTDEDAASRDLATRTIDVADVRSQLSEAVSKLSLEP